MALHMVAALTFAAASALAPAVPGLGASHALRYPGYLRSRTITLNEARPSLYEQESNSLEVWPLGLSGGPTRSGF